jgi:formate/nitrite transporter FocA (FNT family)
MLTEGFLFTVALTILTSQVLRKDKKKIFYALFFGFGLFIIALVNGQIR